MNSLVVSKIKNINFKNTESLSFFEQYIKDIYPKKNFTNSIEIIPPFSNKKSEKILAYEICDQIYKKILEDLSQSLNKLHEKKLDNRSWEIILGDWLMYFVWIMYERYNSLNNIIRLKKFDKIYGTKKDNFIFAGNNTTDIVYSSIDNDWNSNLYFKILKYIEFDKNKIFFENSEAEIKSEDKVKKNEYNFSKKLFEKFINFFSFLESDNDALIINTYLPPIYEKIFELIMLQVPKIWKFKKINYKNINPELRSKIKINLGEEKNFDNFIRLIIKDFLPVCVVESFSDISTYAQNAGLPKNPKFIFTSNDFEGNEIFKFFTADLIMKKKTPYIIGQHGNLYFSDLRIDKYRTEFNSCDKFLTWGHSKATKFKKQFNFSSYGRKKYKSQDKKELLIVISPLDYRIYPYNTVSQTESGYINVLDILELIDEKILRNTIIRLNEQYNTSKGKYYFDKYFKNQSVKIETKGRNFVDARSNSKLSFFNYDSTGILENLALNFPTICLWDNLKENINDSFLPKYQMLMNAKILFTDKNKLAEHINVIWNDVDSWWFSNKTQEYIKKFNENFNIQGNFKSLFDLKKMCLKK